MKRLGLFLITACLSVGVMAADVIKGERKEVFGDITVHYNTFNSTFLTPVSYTHLTLPTIYSV